MNDAEFVAAFDECTRPKTEFTHEGHLRLAWLTLRATPNFDAALDLFRARLQRYAASIGKPGVYHETLTVLWLRLVAHARAQSPAAQDSFDEFLARNVWLRDRANPAKHYSAERLESITARRSFVEADLQALPE